MRSSCPSAPSRLRPLRLHQELIEVGTILHRFHPFDTRTGRYGGDAFNPSVGADWTSATTGARFSPFPHKDPSRSDYVPALYGAAELSTAIYESVFHEAEPVPDTEIYWADLLAKNWHLTELEVTAPIPVVSITTPNLRGMRVPGRRDSLTISELVHSERESYPRTRAWGRHFYFGISGAGGWSTRPGLGTAERWSSTTTGAAGREGHSVCMCRRFRSRTPASSARSVVLRLRLTFS